MAATDAGRLEGTMTALAGGQLAVPLVEVPGRQIGDWNVAELGEDDGLGRPPGVVESPGGPAPGLAVAQPFLDQGADGRRRVRGAQVVVQFLLSRPQLSPRFRLVLGLDGLGPLPGVTRHRVGADEDTEAPGAWASSLNRPCTLGSSRWPGRWPHAGNTDQREAKGARRGARAAESDSLLMRSIQVRCA